MPRLPNLQRKTLPIIVAAAAVIASAGLLRIVIDNRIEHWVDPAGESAQRYDAFQEQFGSDEFALIAYNGQDLFDVDLLDVQLDVLDHIESIPTVARVFSLATVYRDNFGAEDPGELEREFLDTPFYQRFLVSEDGDMAGYFVLVEPATHPDSRTKLAAHLREAAQPLLDAGFTVHHAGSPVLNAAMDLESLNEARFTFAIAAVVSVLVLIVMLRSLRGAAIAIVCASLTTTATIGIVGISGQALNMMTSVLPALLWVLTLANPIHIIRRFQSEVSDASTRDAAVTAALRATILPCTLSSLTTAAGFMSLTMATIEPLREFGIFAAIGFVISLVVSIALVPSLLAALGASRWQTKELGLATTALRCVHAVHRRPRITLAAGLACAGAAAACIPYVSIDSNPVRFFDEEHEMVRAYQSIGEHLTGFYSLEIVIRTQGNWLDAELWEELERVSGALAATTGVTRVRSPLDLLKKANQWDQDFDPDAYTLPENPEAAAKLIEEFGPAENDLLRQLVTDDGKTVRLSVLAHTMQNTGLVNIVESAQRAIEDLPPTYTAQNTGLVPHIVQSHEKLVRTQIRTLAVAFSVVFICILLGLRSLPLTLLSIPPNALPILASLALMAVTGIKLDVATVMTASVVLGIAVDDTVHVLTAYRRLRTTTQSPREAWAQTVDRVGPAILVTTITACTAFATLSVAGFVPLRHFGQLACFAIAIAFIADLLLLPSLSLILNRARRND